MITGRARDIPPFIVMDVLERAQEMERAGVDVVHLEIGEPDFDTPQCIKEAAIRAMADGLTHYTHSLGVPALRAAIAAHYHEKYRVTVSPDQVIVTAGTSPAMLMIFSALLETGDEVIISDPHYACYPNFINFIGGRPVMVEVYQDDGFQLDPEEINRRLTSRTKAVFINSPANPTGTLIDPARMRRIAEIAPLVISDEIYHGLVYGPEREHSILEFTDRAVVINGFSKLYAMTGWRLGYLIVPSEFIRPLQKIHQNFFICAGSVAQWGGLAALEAAGPDVARMRSIYDERRRYLLAGLGRLGFDIKVEPTGAFYILADARHLDPSSNRLAFDILEKAHVGVTPGVDFGANAEGFLRFSYATSIIRIEEGLNRLRSYLETHGRNRL